MVAFVQGIVEYTDVNTVVIENNGIGFLVNVPASNIYQHGENVKLFTYMSVKEDDISLYGFSSRDELMMFKKLIGVNGIGPKAGLGILSTFSCENLRDILLSEDAKTLSKAPGIGLKTAQKIIFELKSKLGEFATIMSNNKVSDNRAISDAIEGLEAFGYTKAEATKAVLSIENADLLTSEQLLKQALKKL